MKVLVNAYSCSPYRGSEPGAGWNWCINLAKHCELFIITGEHWRNNIESALPQLSQKENLHFYYNAVPERALSMAKNQGDWRFYWYYKEWQKRTLKIAKKICEDNEIDIVHQLNWVSFREPGFLWKLNLPLVWGPIGGLGITPKAYIEGASLKWRFLFSIKDKLSLLQLKYSPRVRNMFSYASALISAVPIAQQRIKDIRKRESILIPETGCYDLTTEITDKRRREGFEIIWVGRFIYTKRLDIALQTISRIKDIPGLHFHIVGSGSDIEVLHYKQLCQNLGIEEICIWHGNVENVKVHELMRNADLFFFTSIREATSTVIPEAINNCLPIVCFNACGFGPLVTEKIGRKVELTTPQQSIKDFSQIIRELYHNKDLLYNMSLNCHEVLKQLLWDEKARKVVEIYESIIKK